MSMTEVDEVRRTKVVHSAPVMSAGLGTWKFWAGLVIVGLLGAWMVICAAQARMGMNTDATAYYGTTKRVMAGDGPRWPYGAREQDLPLTLHFPPLFQLVAGHLSSALGVNDPQVTVSYLHGLLLGATAVLTGWMVRRHTGSGWWALGAAVFVVVTADVMDTFANFMSEPLFIFLGTAGLVAVDTGARRRGLLAALTLVFLGGILIGAAYWCRYAGVAFIAAAGVGVLFYPGMSWRRRLLLAAVAGVPMLAGWFGLSQYVGSIPRCIRFQPDQLVHLAAMVWMPGQWVLPVGADVAGTVLAWAGILCGAMLVLRGLQRREEPALTKGAGSSPMEMAACDGRGAPAMPWVFVSGTVLYGGLMAFSAVCVYPPATPLEPRLLVPWLPVLTITAAWALRRRMHASSCPQLAHAGLAMMLLAIALGNGPRLLERLEGEEQDRVGYTSTRWKNSETARWVREHVPAKAVIFCNRCDALYYLADRNSVWIPKAHAGGILPRLRPEIRPEFAAETAQMCEQMGRQGYLVCFDEAWGEQFGIASPRELVAAVKEGALVPEAVTNDGAIYRWRSGAD